MTEIFFERSWEDSKDFLQKNFLGRVDHFFFNFYSFLDNKVSNFHSFQLRWLKFFLGVPGKVLGMHTRAFARACAHTHTHTHTHKYNDFKGHLYTSLMNNITHTGKHFTTAP